MTIRRGTGPVYAVITIIWPFVHTVLLSFAAIAADPAEKFDLRFWKLQLPMDDNKDGKVDEIDVRQLGKYSHPDFFYLEETGSS